MSVATLAQPADRKRTAALTLAALGVVFGDIGTSPLYTIKECFSEYTGVKPTHDNVLGMLSMKLGRSLQWDGEKELVIGDDEANKLLSREYRKPWEYPT